MGGATTTLTHNGFGELTGQTATFGGDTLYQAAYTRDNGGRITGLTETARGVTTTWDYDYSASGRLFRVVRDSADTTVYSYDANGNRIQVVSPLGTVTGTYDGEDRLQTYGGADYTYNNAGQLTQKDAGGQVTSYTYDVLGNLTAVTLPDSTQISYLVDGQGRRIGKKGNGVLVQGWLWQGQLAPVAELDGSGQVVSRFVYGTRVNVPDYLERGGETYRLVTNHLGSVALVVNASTGQVVSWRDYDEWGRVVADSNPDFQPFGFAGGLYDGATGLVRFGARDYYAALGRWTTRDPVGYRGGDASLHAYVRADPLNGADPSGLWIETGLDLASLALSLRDYACRPSLLNGFWVGLDGISALIPILPALGLLRHGDDVADLARRMTPDQRALKDLVDEVTHGGRKPLSVEDAETVLDWAEEVDYPGLRAGPGDVANPSNWTANPVPHIHIPGAGRGGHVPVQPGVTPRP